MLNSFVWFPLLLIFQLLASHFEWFHDAFDKMTKDGRETQWRQITEHDKPEMVALPDGLDEKYVTVLSYALVSAAT